MANIKINNLQPRESEIEFNELSDLELETIMGGKISIGEIGRRIDRGVRRNIPGGWITVIGAVAGE